MVDRIEELEAEAEGAAAIIASERAEVLALRRKLAEMTQMWLQACDVTDLAGELADAKAKLSQMLEIVRSHDTGDMRREDMEARRILAKLEAVVKGEAND